MDIEICLVIRCVLSVKTQDGPIQSLRGEGKEAHSDRGTLRMVTKGASRTAVSRNVS